MNSRLISAKENRVSATYPRDCERFSFLPCCTYTSGRGGHASASSTSSELSTAPQSLRPHLSTRPLTIHLTRSGRVFRERSLVFIDLLRTSDAAPVTGHTRGRRYRRVSHRPQLEVREKASCHSATSLPTLYRSLRSSDTSRTCSISPDPGLSGAVLLDAPRHCALRR